LVFNAAAIVSVLILVLVVVLLLLVGFIILRYEEDRRIVAIQHSKRYSHAIYMYHFTVLHGADLAQRIWGAGSHFEREPIIGVYGL
jgi:hypothetical protein